MTMQDVFTVVFSAKAPNGGNATVKERANVVVIHLGTLVHTRVSARECTSPHDSKGVSRTHANENSPHQ